MSETTEKLQLFKYNTATDSNEVFSIDKALNDNWDKIDQAVKDLKTMKNLDPEGEKRFSDLETKINNSLSATVLLAENGYIKFNNGFLIQKSRTVHKESNFTTFTLSFPISFTNKSSIITVGCDEGAGCYIVAMKASSVTSASIWLKNSTNSCGIQWIAIGN